MKHLPRAKWLAGCIVAGLLIGGLGLYWSLGWRTATQNWSQGDALLADRKWDMARTVLEKGNAAAPFFRRKVVVSDRVVAAERNYAVKLAGEANAALVRGDFATAEAKLSGIPADVGSLPEAMSVRAALDRVAPDKVVVKGLHPGTETGRQTFALSDDKPPVLALTWTDQHYRGVRQSQITAITLFEYDVQARQWVPRLVGPQDCADVKLFAAASMPGQRQLVAQFTCLERGTLFSGNQTTVYGYKGGTLAALGNLTTLWPLDVQALPAKLVTHSRFEACEHLWNGEIFEPKCERILPMYPANVKVITFEYDVAKAAITLSANPVELRMGERFALVAGTKGTSSPVIFSVPDLLKEQDDGSYIAIRPGDDVFGLHSKMFPGDRASLRVVVKQ